MLIPNNSRLRWTADYYYYHPLILHEAKKQELVNAFQSAGFRDVRVLSWNRRVCAVGSCASVSLSFGTPITYVSVDEALGDVRIVARKAITIEKDSLNIESFAQSPSTTPTPKPVQQPVQHAQASNDVRAIQVRLNHLPSLLPRLVTDGLNGAKTRARIVEFQQMNHLTPDGIVGTKTRAMLFGGSASPSLSPTPYMPPNIEPFAPPKSNMPDWLLPVALVIVLALVLRD
jgi:hypothetical protein